jgi:hypothetical protein
LASFGFFAASPSMIGSALSGSSFLKCISAIEARMRPASDGSSVAIHASDGADSSICCGSTGGGWLSLFICREDISS